MSAHTVVLALDAADYRLAKEWECSNILGESHSALTTYAFSKAMPSTLEIWPLIAANQDPDSGDDYTREWDSLSLRLATSVSGIFPSSVRSIVGERLVNDAEPSVEFPTLPKSAHPFDSCYHWPGVSEAEDLGDTWNLFDKIEAGEIDDTDLWRCLHAEIYSHIGDALSSEGYVGVHSHILDIAGHTYANDEKTLRRYYDSVDAIIKNLNNIVDNVVIISDHGISVLPKRVERVLPERHRTVTFCIIRRPVPAATAV